MNPAPPVTRTLVMLHLLFESPTGCKLHVIVSAPDLSIASVRV